MIFFGRYNNGAKDAAGWIDLCMPYQFLEAEELSFVPIPLAAVFDHPNDVKALFKDFMDEGFVGKPRIHQHTGCLNAGFQCSMDQCGCGLWLLHNGIPPCFRAIGPPVNEAIGRIDALFFLADASMLNATGRKL